jgi:O-succinylbenzoic acid--CoA ligase
LVTDVAVVGIKDPVFIEAVGALVVGDFSADADPEAELRKFAMHSLAEFKIPSVIRRVSEIPKTATGKLDRRAAVQSLLATTHSAPGGEQGTKP